MTDIPANITTKAVLEGVVEFGALSGSLETPGDHDWIRLILNPGPAYGFYLSFLNTGSVIGGDAFLALRDADGNVVVSNDDGGASLNSFLSITVGSGGVFFLDVGEVADNNIGDYSLKNSPVRLLNFSKCCTRSRHVDSRT